jgi:uncharacterized protein with FMN-binding domain
MKRAAIVTGAAVVGVVWIASYKVAPHLPAVASLPSAPTPSDGRTASPATPGIATPSPSPDVPNRFGDVQVRVVISNGHISDVLPVQMPYDRERSAYISQVAGPMLRSEVLQAQSAQIDIISGATYTSESYAQSVESALQQAHMG